MTYEEWREWELCWWFSGIESFYVMSLRFGGKPWMQGPRKPKWMRLGCYPKRIGGEA
jgi:hypothetical protein